MVSKDDIQKVVLMSKDSLKIYAQKELSISLDLADDKWKKISTIRAYIVKIIKEKLDIPVEKDDATIEEVGETSSVKVEWLYNPSNKTVLEATEFLLKRSDLIPCDKNGNSLDIKIGEGVCR